MPGLLHRTVHIEDDWYPESYWIWRPYEIVERWRDSATLKKNINLETEKNLVRIYCEMERAVEYAAMWMREVHDDIDCTYYEEEYNRLTLYYGARNRLETTDDAAERIYKEAKLRTIKLVEYMMKKPYLSSFYVDTMAARLFSKVA